MRGECDIRRCNDAVTVKYGTVRLCDAHWEEFCGTKSRKTGYVERPLHESRAWLKSRVYVGTGIGAKGHALSPEELRRLAHPRPHWVVRRLEWYNRKKARRS